MLDGSFMVPRETPPWSSSSFRGEDDALQTATILCLLCNSARLRNPTLLWDVNVMNAGLIKVDAEDFRWQRYGRTTCLMLTELMAVQLF